MARRFARRRKPRVVWLPVYGNDGTVDASGDNAIGGVAISLAVATDGSIGWDAQSLTFDFTEDATNTQYIPAAAHQTLQDLVSGNEYRLRRIVGKLHAAATTLWPNQGEPTAIVPAVEYAAGFIVVRTDDSGIPTTDFDYVNPLAQDSMEDPWIWRRKWILSTYQSQWPTWTSPPVQQGVYFCDWPQNTARYGSVADGPHIDQKTARVIHRSERLFFVQAARVYNPLGLPLSNTGYNEALIQGHLDLRLLASIKPSSSGNRHNASR